MTIQSAESQMNGSNILEKDQNEKRAKLEEYSVMRSFGEADRDNEEGDCERKHRIEGVCVQENNEDSKENDETDASSELLQSREENYQLQIQVTELQFKLLVQEKKQKQYQSQVRSLQSELNEKEDVKSRLELPRQPQEEKRNKKSDSLLWRQLMEVKSKYDEKEKEANQLQEQLSFLQAQEETKNGIHTANSVKAEASIQQLKNQVQKLRHELMNSQSKLNEQEKTNIEITQLHREVSDLTSRKEEDMSLMSQLVETRSKLEEKEKEAIQLQRQLSFLQADAVDKTATYTMNIGKAEEEIIQLKKQVQNLTGTLNSKEEEMTTLLSFLSDAVTDSKEQISKVKALEGQEFEAESKLSNTPILSKKLENLKLKKNESQKSYIGSDPAVIINMAEEGENPLPSKEILSEPLLGKEINDLKDKHTKKLTRKKYLDLKQRNPGKQKSPITLSMRELKKIVKENNIGLSGREILDFCREVSSLEPRELLHLAATGESGGQIFEESESKFEDSWQTKTLIKEDETDKCINGKFGMSAPGFANAEVKKQSRQWINKAIVEMVKKAEDNSHDVATDEDLGLLYNSMGFVYMRNGDYDGAMNYFTKHLSISMNVHGEEHQETADAHSNVGQCYETIGNYEAALKQLKLALSTYRKTVGEVHPSTSIAYGAMGGCYRKKGKLNLALDSYRKSAEIKRATLGVDHPGTATMLNNVALCYRDKGESHLAVENYMACLCIEEKVLGKRHPSTALTYYNIGALYYEMDNFTEAENYMKLALDIQENLLGLNHPHTLLSQGWYEGIVEKHFEEIYRELES